MAGPVSDRNSFSTRGYRNVSKVNYDINGMARPSGVAYRGQRTQVLSEEIITEGDKQLQELLKKQLDTRVSLNNLLASRKQFTDAKLSRPLINDLGGAMTLESYDKCIQNSEEIDELRQAGLTEEEIILKLQSDTNQLEATRFGIDPLVMCDRLKEIDEKLDNHRRHLQQPTKFAGAKVISRQEMDLEQAITKNREKTKQFGCLVTDRSHMGIIDPSHPINHLDEIIRDVSMKPNDKKTKRLKLDVAKIQKEGKHLHKSSSESEESEIESDSDKKVICENFDVPNRPPLTSVLLADGTRAIQGNIESIPEDVIRRFRLSIEQIQDLPRFKAYEPGEPSQILYLKNLSSRVTEADLVALFCRFQKIGEPKIVFRLLKGRMKGQAFVKFSSVEMASAALELVNGYDFKGKPLIIEYGKRATMETKESINME